jgi:hypothetical protein
MRYLYYATYSKLQANLYAKKLSGATRSAGAFPATAVRNVISVITVSHLKRCLSLNLRASFHLARLPPFGILPVKPA